MLGGPPPMEFSFALFGAMAAPAFGLAFWLAVGGGTCPINLICKLLKLKYGPTLPSDPMVTGLPIFLATISPFCSTSKSSTITTRLPWLVSRMSRVNVYDESVNRVNRGDEKGTWLAIWLQTSFFTLITVYWGKASSCTRWFNWENRTGEKKNRQCWLDLKKIWTILLSDTFTSPKLYLGGKHGKAVAVFTIVQQQAESKNVSNNELFDKQPKMTRIALKMHLVLPTQKRDNMIL